ncbi:DUF2267 domain-containing protein [Streptomyces chromofuscus]|uniref:DUF2267 domain-containing protein n=1 Tax=Streptomyces chromofuscus TaxID=42881 RepID=A0A7M2TF92_STRCW|nr:DUF2267 domain-containing protein [Streptomyces chromofuscus]QOV46884.1 DUF2267 domain-containing protein [Streptomyces chromofuscus]GGT14289.1 hypothetical protein GCM10010254_38650 [Streptomyces chromofuscus]
MTAPTLSPLTTPAPHPRPATTWADLITAVQDTGQYPTRAEAERITRIVLSALGGHVTGDERVALAQALPEEAARLVAAHIPVTRPLTAPEFVDRTAARIEGATPATARWDVSSVLCALPPLLGDALVDDILRQLPPGYALLFGRAELGAGARPGSAGPAGE